MSKIHQILFGGQTYISYSGNYWYCRFERAGGWVWRNGTSFYRRGSLVDRPVDSWLNRHLSETHALRVKEAKDKSDYQLAHVRKCLKVAMAQGVEALTTIFEEAKCHAA